MTNDAFDLFRRFLVVAFVWVAGTFAAAGLMVWISTLIP